MASTSFASAIADSSPSSVKVLTPMRAPPFSASSLFSASNSPSSPTQGLQVVNQKFTTVTALPENRVLLSTSFPSRSLPVKAGNFCAVLPSSGGVVVSLPAGTLVPPSSAGAPDKLGNFSSNAASRSSIFLISVAFSFSSSYSSSVNCSLAASMVLSRNSP